MGVSEQQLASWGASEGVEFEESVPEPEPAPEPVIELPQRPKLRSVPGGGSAAEPQSKNLETLAGMSLSSGGLSFGGFEASEDSGSDSKHDELADAVESALRSVYGDQPAAKSGQRPFQSQAIGEDSAPPSLVWNKGSNASSGELTPQEVILNYFDYNAGEESHSSAAGAEPVRDSLTPQEVILNYFDYPGGEGSNGYPNADYSEPQRSEEPIALRASAEPIVSRRRAQASEAPPFSFRNGRCRLLSRSNIAGLRHFQCQAPSWRPIPQPPPPRKAAVCSAPRPSALWRHRHCR